MKLNLNKEEIEQVNQIIEAKNINMALADMLLYLYSINNFPHTNDLSVFLDNILEELELNPDDEDNIEAFNKLFIPDFKILNENDLKNNPYFKNIKINKASIGKYELGFESYLPYQLFCYDEINVLNDDNYLEQYRTGFYKNKVSYPVISYKKNVWMCITPNEINTMQPHIDKAFGNVVVYGLGLGYFPYMISLKDNVKSITIIEKDPNIIALFKHNIFNQFKFKNKITIIEDDAFNYMKKDIHYDYAFFDIYRSPNDGLPLYLKAKSFEKPNTLYGYWLEPSLLAMLRRCMLTLIEESLNGFTDKDYLKAENDYDELINKFYNKTKALQINSFEELNKLLANENLLDTFL